MRFTLVLVLALLVLAPAAQAKDTVPSKARARAWAVERLPAAAPAALLKDGRGARYTTKRLWVEKASRCERNRVQVECRFVVLLTAKLLGPIRCRGEVWIKARDGRLLGRIGYRPDFVCKAA